tara:strand:+ start:448 stop:630 length:183 start_codon:yes stop_codon:yes gene_type:complete
MRTTPDGTTGCDTKRLKMVMIRNRRIFWVDVEVMISEFLEKPLFKVLFIAQPKGFHIVFP